jgi:integrase
MLVRLKGIKPVTVRYNGTVYRYYYHRATGAKIKAEPGSAAFVAEVQALDKKAAEEAPVEGSLKALIVAYKASPEFETKAARTKSDYNKVFDYLKDIDELMVQELDTGDIYDIRDKAFKKRKRRFANYVVQVLSLLFAWGRPRKYIVNNVAEGVEAIERPKKMKRANRPWSDQERDVVLTAAPIMLRVMIALGMFGGLREGDACVTLKDAYDGRLLETVASKNGEPLFIPTHYRLRQILVEAAEARKAAQARRSRRRKVVPIDPPTLAVTSKGKTWTESGFRASFFKLIGALEEKGAVAPGLTFHGLRHTLGKLIVEAGGTPAMVKAIIGDRSDDMANFYSREFDKKRLAGEIMGRLEQNERARMEKTADDDGKKKNDVG